MKPNSSSSSFYSIFLLLLALTGSCRSKLLFLQSVFRHGDRAPTNLYPNDPNPVSVWPEGLGQLTQLGKRQQYMLGKQLRSLYSDFITSNPAEVFVNSTDKDRCLRSAECHLAGLYEPTPEWQFVPGYLWQPIPIHYKRKQDDIYLNPNAKCPRAKKDTKRLFHSHEFKKFEKPYKPILKSLSSCAGKRVTKNNAYVLATTLKTEMEYNLSIPSCMLPYYDQLQNFTQVTHNLEYESPLVRKVRGGPLLGKMVENMNMKIAGEIPDQKVQVYSARNANVVAILSALGLFNGHTPPYCATVLFELHGSPDDNFTVRLLFLNSTRPQDGDQTPHVLQLPGCTEYCPLEYFDNYTRPLVPRDFDEECGLHHHH